MCVLWVALIGVFGVTDVWTESPMVQVLPDSRPSENAAEEARLYAARGERESFQLCIRARRKPVKNIGIVAGRIDEEIGPPEIRRVGYLHVTKNSPRAVAQRALWPDPLLDFKPFSLSPGETCALWVTYGISHDAAPGTHNGKLTVVSGKGRKRNVSVTLNVFAFALPETPSLRTGFPLDRKAAYSVWHISDTDLRQWKPIYEALAGNRLSFRLWDGGDLVGTKRDGSAATGRFKEHLEYAVSAAHMNGIDIGAGRRGILPFPDPPPGSAQDPLQFYLHDMGNWLEERGWLEYAYVEAMPVPERDQWQKARDAYFRVNRGDERIARLLTGGIHPYFERYTDVWAVPFRHFDPFAFDALQAGDSLRTELVQPTKAVTASSSGALPGSTSDGPSTDRTSTDRMTACASRAEDGYDGCFFTFWLSGSAPSHGKREWFQLDLRGPVTTQSFKIIWKAGFESTDITTRTSLEGSAFTTTDVQWRHYTPAGPYAHSWAEGTFAHPRPFRSIRLEFSGSFNGGPVGITEVILVESAAPQPVETIEPVEMWLSAEAQEFPSFCVDAHRAEARMFPWVCWGHRAKGFVYDALNHWPSGWAGRALEQPLVWSGGGAGEAFLFYPGRRAPIPSVRSQLLRDGMEDYEYLAALAHVIDVKEITDTEMLKLCAHEFYPPDPSKGDLDEYAEAIAKKRVRIGRALTEIAKKGR